MPPCGAILPAMIYRFGDFELDTARVELRLDGDCRPVEPQVFGLLALLVENRERMVSRDEIVEKVWDGRAISDAAVASRIKSARQVLGDDGRNQGCIRTIHGKGFRFVADVQVVPGSGSPAPQALPEPPLRPSIAVLPFGRLGAQGPGDTMAEALPHDLITELARLRWLFVTARASSFRLGPAAGDLGEVGRVLGVRYCLSGSVEVLGSGLVVTVELADTQDRGVVWAERFCGSVGDVHRFRDEIRSRILAALEIQIPLHEAAQARLGVTENLDAWSAYHLGLQHMYRFNRRDNAAATALFEQAITRDPTFARAHAGLSFVHFQNAFLRYTEDLGGEVHLARRFAERGLELDPLDPFVHFTMGRSYWLVGDLDGGLAWLERATVLSPSYAQGIYACGWTETLAGRGLEGRRHVDLAMRLSPLDPLYYAMLGTRAMTHMSEGQNVEAVDWAERAARSPGAHVLIAMIAAAAHGLAGDQTRAQAWATDVRRRNPALGREDFFRAFPVKSERMKTRLSQALGCSGL